MWLCQVFYFCFFKFSIYFCPSLSMCIIHKEDEAALIFNSQYLLLIKKLCISRVMKHDTKWIFVIVFVKQASLYSILSVSKRMKKLLFPLFQAPLYLNSLGKQSVECRRICLYLYKQNFYTDLIIILLLLKKNKKKNYMA